MGDFQEHWLLWAPHLPCPASAVCNWVPGFSSCSFSPDLSGLIGFLQFVSFLASPFLQTHFTLIQKFSDTIQAQINKLQSRDLQTNKALSFFH